MASSPPPPIREVDKLTNQIFSILENKFLFGHHTHFAAAPTGKIRILSIDSGGEGILAATALLYLQTILRRKSGNPSAHISDFFDVVTGAGEGGILAGLLFTRGKNGRRDPMFSGEEALKFIVHNRRELSRYPSTSVGVFGRRKKAKVLDGVFGEATLRDTVKAVLIPCFDLRSGAPFLFSRADAVEMEGCDFRMAGVCGATMAGGRAVELKSTDGKKRIVAVGGGVGGMSNPTAAAITHVLNNKQDFPECKGVEDLLVVSLGNGHVNSSSKLSSSTPDAFLKIAADGAADIVDQAVSMAFGEHRISNYIRIQGNGVLAGAGSEKNKYYWDEMLGQKNVESVLFRGKKVVEFTNLEKLEMFAGELIKEQERRRRSLHSPPSPRRSSSATTLSTLSSY